MKPKTLQAAIQHFANPDVCIEAVAAMRWPNGPVCPECGHTEHYYLKTQRRWKCKDCKRQFSVKIGTIFEAVSYTHLIISHDRRRILHFNVTGHPTSPWIVQQLREAFPYDLAPRYLILDRDRKYGWKYLPPFDRCRSVLCVLHFRARGKTGSPSAGWKAAGTICWIM